MARATICCLFVCATIASAAVASDSITGKYVEVRTCQIYTGPCFANGEVGAAGKNAIMTWRVDRGSFDGVDLTGLSAAMIVKATHTLGFNGFQDADKTGAVLVFDEQADEQQRSAIQRFVLAQTGLHADDIAGTKSANIDLQFNMADLTAVVDVEDIAHIQTRKARKGDCICSNESAYYPPLTDLFQFVPGVTIEGDVKARRLGTRWSIPDSRSSYMGVFQVDQEDVKLAGRL